MEYIMSLDCKTIINILIIFIDLYKGVLKKQNYLLEARSLAVQAALLGGCSRNPSLSERQLVLLWEAAFGFNEFENSFNTFAYFMIGDLWAHLATPCWVLSSFWPKMAWPQCPTLPINLISPWTTLFVSPDKKKSSNILLM